MHDADVDANSNNTQQHYEEEKEGLAEPQGFYGALSIKHCTDMYGLTVLLSQYSYYCQFPGWQIRVQEVNKLVPLQLPQPCALQAADRCS